jgi:mRNA interferase HigB
MRLAGRLVLQRFIAEHADARSATAAWVGEVEGKTWSSPGDIKLRYPSASFLPNNRVIFNIKGNKYRFVVVVIYAGQTVLVEWAGTHAEYSKRY